MSPFTIRSVSPGTPWRSWPASWTLGPGQLESHRARLEALGVTDDAELSDRIRSGEFDDRADLVDALRADSRDRLLVANPGWLPPEGNLG